MAAFRKFSELSAEIRILIWNCFHDLTPPQAYHTVRIEDQYFQCLPEDHDHRLAQILLAHSRMLHVLEKLSSLVSTVFHLFYNMLCYPSSPQVDYVDHAFSVTALNSFLSRWKLHRRFYKYAKNQDLWA